jgi:hypothetical protein
MAIQIGDLFQGDFLPDSEGPVLDIGPHHCQLVLKLNHISEAEVHAFRRRKAFELALYVEEECAFVLLRVEDLADWADAPYNLWTTPQAKLPTGPRDGAGAPKSMTIVLVDGEDRLVHGVQEFELPREFSNELLNVIENQRRAPLSPDEAIKRIRSVQRKRTAEQMLKKALARVVG